METVSRRRPVITTNFEFLDKLLKLAAPEFELVEGEKPDFKNWETVCIEVDNVGRQIHIVGYSEANAV
jgi:hypothetical protein